METMKIALILLTTVAVVITVAIVVETVLIDGTESIEFVNRQLCNEDGYYHWVNEFECELVFIPVIGYTWIFTVAAWFSYWVVLKFK